MTDADKKRLALRLCIELHSRQIRKYTGEPYAVHPISVANMVESAGCGVDAVCAAYLHDVLEDTAYTYEQIKSELGKSVADMVRALTSERREDENRAARKQREKDRISLSSDEVKTIKLADLIDNTRDIVKHDPSFARQYVKEKKDLLEVLIDGDVCLWFAARNQIAEWEKENGMEAGSRN